MSAERVRALTPAVLRRLPIPQPGEDADKEARGLILAVGGSASVPGAILLAGVGALRAGAGKLQLATVRGAAASLGVAVPEALVVALPAGRGGELSGARAARLLRPRLRDLDALLVGAGMGDAAAARALLEPLVTALQPHTVLVLDAAAIVALRRAPRLLRALGGRAILTPHAGEMAGLTGAPRGQVERNARDMACEVAARYGAVVALKGAESWIADPSGRCLHYRGGTVGLATSGSGDTLAGIVAGLAARGADPLHAAAWGVHVHGAAGRVLERRVGRVGFLARELLDEVPRILGRGRGSAR